MGAFNWIIVRETCPQCRNPAELRCQVHIASSHDGDDSGRFHDRTYELGQKMAWWPLTDNRFGQWRVDGRKGEQRDPDLDEEACYTTCSHCQTELCVVIRFHQATPVDVVLVAKAENWPAEY